VNLFPIVAFDLPAEAMKRHIPRIVSPIAERSTELNAAPRTA